MSTEIQIYLFPKPIQFFFETMKEDLKKVVTWFKANKISLNISKTKYSLIHSTRKRTDITNILPPLHIENASIKKNSSQRLSEYI